MLMIEGGGVLALMRFWMAIRPPKVVLVSAQAAISMAALGADALAHSASRMASASLGATTPGAAQLFPGCEGSRGGAGEAESLAEIIPVRSAEDIGVFNKYDGLSLARNACVENWIQVVNRG